MTSPYSDAMAQEAPVDATIARITVLETANTANTNAHLWYNALFSVIVKSGICSGYALSNNPTDANNDIDIAAGYCTSFTGTSIIQLSSSMTKRLDAVWAAGTGNGGLDTGTKAVSTWYYVYAIGGTWGIATDIIFSLSSTAPAYPSGYSVCRRIGAIRTDGYGTIMPFFQRGQYFWWRGDTTDAWAYNNPGTAVVTLALTLPAIPITAIITASAYAAQGSSINMNIGGPSNEMGVVNQYFCHLTASPATTSDIELLVPTTDSTIRYRLLESDAGVYIKFITRGWIDTTI